MGVVGDGITLLGGCLEGLFESLGDGFVKRLFRLLGIFLKVF